MSQRKQIRINKRFRREKRLQRAKKVDIGEMAMVPRSALSMRRSRLALEVNRPLREWELGRQEESKRSGHQ